MQLNRRERGDTLVEVMIVLAVLGALVTIAYSVMNRGFGIMQNSLDRTNVQAQVNGQASILRAVHSAAMQAGGQDNDNYDNWKTIIERAAKQPADFISITPETMNASACQPSLNENAPGGLSRKFYFNPSSTTDIMISEGTSIFKRSDQSAVPGDGIWIEGHTYDDVLKKGQYVFYIKACWVPLYGSGPENEYKSVVKLYDPFQ